MVQNVSEITRKQFENLIDRITDMGYRFCDTTDSAHIIFRKCLAEKCEAYIRITEHNAVDLPDTRIGFAVSISFKDEPACREFVILKNGSADSFRIAQNASILVKKEPFKEAASVFETLYREMNG